jgi:phage gp29-like protein
MMTMIKQIKAALSTVARNGLDALQAGPRSTQGNTLNYMSVNTLDPARLASAFAAADQGFITDQATLFELVEEQDAHIFSELAKRRRAVTGLGWQLTPPEDANQSEIDRTDELEDILRKIPRFEDMQYDLCDAIGKGISAHEIDWQTGSTWYPKSYVWVPQRAFQIDRTSGQLMYVKNGVPEALREWGWVVHEHRAKSGYIEQAALFRVLAWTYAYKAYNIRDMQRFLEMYGLPLRLGKYPAGIDKGQRDQLLKAVRNIGNDGAGVVPSNMSIDFVQAMKSGTVDDFLNATSYWERKQSMAILGGTLTSQADGKTSTNALGHIHDKVRREIMEHDVSQITPTMNSQVVRPIALINAMFPPDRVPEYEYQTEETPDQAKLVDVLSKAADMGMEIDVEWAHKAVQIPRADKGAKLLVPGKPSPAISPADAALTRLVALASTANADPDITSAYGTQLATLCAPFEQSLIQQISAIVAEAGDFDAALEGIATLKADPKWAEAMVQGMAAANLAGRVDVGRGDDKNA